ncbi:hypothetical protein LZ30DRAFT_730514 [Colletotrichum cereale]|nr:hypothetical protein LZ30DRAFT_730514 [Colletotrichum cereale]
MGWPEVWGGVLADMFRPVAAPCWRRAPNHRAAGSYAKLSLTMRHQELGDAVVPPSVSLSEPFCWRRCIARREGGGGPGQATREKGGRVGQRRHGAHSRPSGAGAFHGSGSSAAEASAGEAWRPRAWHLGGLGVPTASASRSLVRARMSTVGNGVSACEEADEVATVKAWAARKGRTFLFFSTCVSRRDLLNTTHTATVERIGGSADV